jgi:hypothetical protein
LRVLISLRSGRVSLKFYCEIRRTLCALVTDFARVQRPHVGCGVHSGEAQTDKVGADHPSHNPRKINGHHRFPSNLQVGTVVFSAILLPSFSSTPSRRGCLDSCLGCCCASARRSFPSLSIVGRELDIHTYLPGTANGRR